MIYNIMLDTILLLPSFIAISSPLPHGTYCTDRASDERTNLRFTLRANEYLRGCSGCQGGYMGVIDHSRGDILRIFYSDYTINATADGLKLIFQPRDRLEAFLKRLGLSLTIWDNGLLYTPSGPEDSLVIPIDEGVSTSLTSSNCAQALAGNSTFYCNTGDYPLLQGIRLEFVPNLCSPFIGRLDFLQEASGVFEWLGSVGYGFHDSFKENSAILSLIKTTGTDLSMFLASPALGLDPTVRTYDYWLGNDLIYYLVEMDEVAIELNETVFFSRCPA